MPFSDKLRFQPWDKYSFNMTTNTFESMINIAGVTWQGKVFSEKHRKLSQIVEHLLKESKSSDLHGIVCESTKLGKIQLNADLYQEICRESPVPYTNGEHFILRADKIINPRQEIKCIQQFKQGGFKINFS